MFVSSSKYQEGDRAVLISPRYGVPTPLVMSFHIHMKVPNAYNKRHPSFRIYRQTWKGINDEVLLELHGHQGDEWVRRTVCLPSGSYYLSFEATQGSVFNSDIALDSVQLTDTGCTPSLPGSLKIDKWELSSFVHEY